MYLKHDSSIDYLSGYESTEIVLSEYYLYMKTGKTNLTRHLNHDFDKILNRLSSFPSFVSLNNTRQQLSDVTTKWNKTRQQSSHVSINNNRQQTSDVVTKG